MIEGADGGGGGQYWLSGGGGGGGDGGGGGGGLVLHGLPHGHSPHLISAEGGSTAAVSAADIEELINMMMKKCLIILGIGREKWRRAVERRGEVNTC